VFAGTSVCMKASQGIAEAPVWAGSEGGSNLNVWDRMRASVRKQRTDERSSLTFLALGSWCRVTYETRCEPAASAFASQAIPWLAAFEAKFARHHPGSLVSRINHLAESSWVVLDDEAERMLSVCEELKLITQGAFDPTVLPLTELWMRAGREAIPPTTDEIEEARQLVGWHQLKRCAGGVFPPKVGMGLDLDTLAQAYATDRLVQLAEWHGLACVMVDFRRNKRCKGGPIRGSRWPIQLESPAAPGGAWSIDIGASVALSACSGVRRHSSIAGEWDEPIIDPRTGRLPVHGCHDVVVSAASGFL